MYSDFILIDEPGKEPKRLSRLKLETGSQRNEAWLRDLIHSTPDVLPVRDIDPSYRRLAALCTELQTEAGPIDVALVSPDGRLVLVETKLWRNPQARREVVAQILDYSRTLTRWSYSDLQRQVSARTGEKHNVPFERARMLDPELREAEFVDSVTRALRAGRFLLLIVGDGVREDVQSIAELINRNAASALELALVELVLYEAGGDSLLVQPRVTARTSSITRTVVTVRSDDGSDIAVRDDATSVEQADAPKPGSSQQEAYRKWWQPVLDMAFDDPDQPPPVLYWPNNVRLSLPWGGLSVIAYGLGRGVKARYGVHVTGPSERWNEFLRFIEPEVEQVLKEIPGATLRDADDERGRNIVAVRPATDFPDDDACRTWITTLLNDYVNALRPRLKRLALEVGR